MNLASTVNVGTTMTVRIPLDKALSSSSGMIRRNSHIEGLPLSEYPSWAGTKILIAEDNDLIRDIVTRILTKKEVSNFFFPFVPTESKY